VKDSGKKIFYVLFPLLLVFLCFQLVPGKAKKKVERDPDKLSRPFIFNEGVLKIIIQPLGNISAARIQFIKKEVAAFYKCNELTVNKSLPLPATAWYAPRQRYIADSLLSFLRSVCKTEKTIILGLTDKDISTEKGTNPNYGIMGLGFCPGNACVVSTFRLHKKISAIGIQAENIFLDRLAKVCFHELGHNLGLPHCAAGDSCLMSDAGGTIVQVDKERKIFCGPCKKKVLAFLN
jgi:archaemetzincin